MATRGAPAGVSLLKRAWHEVPDLVISCSLAAAGIVLSGGMLAAYEPYKAHQFKRRYTVVRESDLQSEEERKYAN